MKLLKTMFKKLKAKVNNLDKKISVVPYLIHINQYNTDKKNFRKKWVVNNWDVETLVI